MERISLCKEYRQRFIDELGLDKWNSMTLDSQVTCLTLMKRGYTLRKINRMLRNDSLPFVALGGCGKWNNMLYEYLADEMAQE